MKKIIIIFAVLFLIKSAYAQQRPQYTQYVSNYFLINPAFAGIEKDMNLTASYRKQWAGLSGSPTTSYLTFNTALPNKKAIHDESEALIDNSVLFSLSQPHHAVGFTIINDEAGALNRFVGYATYAYHLQLSSKMNLSAGISAGVSSATVHQDKLALDVTIDPAVHNYSGKTKGDINAGILLYGEKFFAGISVQQIIPSKITSNGNAVNLYGDRKFPDLFVSAGYHFTMNPDLTFSPSVMLKYINTVPLTFDVNAKLDYRNLVWAGYSYRYKSGMAAMAGIRIKEGIRFGYSYDITNSGLQKVSNGTHEFLVAFDLKRK